MKVIERYILKRTLAIFVAALVWVLLIAWTTQVLNRIDFVSGGGQSATAFFTIAALLLVPVIPIVLPFAVGIAVSQTLATMNQDSELVVISAAGSPRTTIIRPLMLVAIVASLLSFAINNTLEPYARQTLRSALANVNADIITSVAQEGVFYKIADDLFVQISERLPQGQLAGIFVADTRDKEAKYIYHAQRGATVERENGSILVLEDGVLQRQTGDGDVSTVQFDSYSLDLSQFTQRDVRAPTLHPKDHYLPYLLDPDPRDRFTLSNPQLFRAELHMRLSEWLYPIVFALIGIAVAGDARSFREARLHPMVTALGIGLLVRWLGFYSGDAAEESPFFSFVLYAAPLGMILICIHFIRNNKPMELPTSWTERMTSRLQKDRARLDSLGARLARLLGYGRKQA
jgi:lipopolysaccharide export system permease protein